MPEKQCSRCNETKSLEDFSKNKNTKDGLMRYCRQCNRDANRKYRSENRERWLENKKKSWARNRQNNLAYKRKHYADNRERLIAYQSEYAKKNKSKVRLIRSEYRARKRAKTFLVLDREIRNICESSCHFCGATDRIQIDHIVPLSRGGRHSIGNLMPLCYSCNASKGSKFYFEWIVIKRGDG